MNTFLLKCLLLDSMDTQNNDFSMANNLQPQMEPPLGPNPRSEIRLNWLLEQGPQMGAVMDHLHCRFSAVRLSLLGPSHSLSLLGFERVRREWKHWGKKIFSYGSSVHAVLCKGTVVPPIIPKRSNVCIIHFSTETHWHTADGTDHLAQLQPTVLMQCKPQSAPHCWHKWYLVKVIVICPEWPKSCLSVLGWPTFCLVSWHGLSLFSCHLTRMRPQCHIDLTRFPFGRL